jgi:hypothetical protein
VGYCETNTQSMIEYCPKSCRFCPNAVNKNAQAKVQAAAAAAAALVKAGR